MEEWSIFLIDLRNMLSLMYSLIFAQSRRMALPQRLLTLIYAAIAACLSEVMAFWISSKILRGRVIVRAQVLVRSS